ncbi:MAG TPA: DUF4139 domain-containing protein, partial [Puia sp.]|nr:DUF4139 domain-containing protein [Puia sp.]
MQKNILFALLCWFVPSAAFAGDGTGTVSSILRSVMVYRSSAELTHTATAHLVQGNNELIIDDVSTALDPASIRVSCSGPVTIMAVSFSKDYLGPQTVSPAVRKLEDSLEALAKESSRLEVLTNSDQQLLDLLNSNKNVGGTQTGVTAAELAKMMDYYRQQEVTIRTEMAGYADKATKIKTTTETLERQIDEEEKKNSKTSGRVTLQLMAPVAGSYDFTVSYITHAAHWEPAYDLKVTGSSEPLQLVYKARVEQSSGIDWNHVKLSLSTSLPSQGGNAPVLKAKFLRFVEGMGGPLNYNNNGAQNALAGAAPGMGLKIDLDAVVVTGYGATGKPLRNDVQGIGAYTNINDNTLDVVFDIDIPYDIPSNGKEHGVDLKEYKLPCTFQDYAAPVADKDAYLLGQMHGWEKLNLLPGEASIMVE